MLSLMQFSNHLPIKMVGHKKKKTKLIWYYLLISRDDTHFGTSNATIFHRIKNNKIRQKDVDFCHLKEICLVYMEKNY